MTKNAHPLEKVKCTERYEKYVVRQGNGFKAKSANIIFSRGVSNFNHTI